MKLAFAATMIRPRYVPDSIVAQLVSMSTFSHTLGQQRTLAALDFMTAFGCKADEIAGKADIAALRIVNAPSQEFLHRRPGRKLQQPAEPDQSPRHESLDHG